MPSSPTTSHQPPATKFRMPAEWEPQTAMWLAWPHQQRDWPGKFAPIPLVYAEIIRHVTRTQRVRLLVKNEAAHASAQTLLENVGADLDKIDFYLIPTNRCWVRDSGPIFVKSGKNKAVLDFRFNAWAKYSNYAHDDKVPGAINTHFNLPIITPRHKARRVVLEGGAIDVNGKGVLITTEECLLSEDVQCRNPGFTREDYEAVFAEYLGIEKVLWLGHGITGDDTHGHVDDITRFVNETTIVTCVEKDKRDANYAPLQENLKCLKAARDVHGKPFTVAELPMPGPLMFEGTRLPASYANFYIANGLVLVPTFNDPHDRVALNILAELFPAHEIVGIHAVDLVWGFGTLHCMSQQEPA